MADARKATEGEDAAALKPAVDRLTKLSHKLAESLYKTTARAGRARRPPGGARGRRRPARGRRRGRRVHGQELMRQSSEAAMASRDGNPS